MDPSFETDCSSCGQHFEASLEMHGLEIDCPACGARTLINDPARKGEAAPPSPPLPIEAPPGRRDGKRKFLVAAVSLLVGLIAIGSVVRGIVGPNWGIMRTAAEAAEEPAVFEEPSKPVVVIDDDYCALAKVLSSPAFFSTESIAEGFTNEAVMLRMEIARQTLATMSIPDPDLETIRGDLSRKLLETKSSMERLRSLGVYTVDIESIASKAIDATPAMYRQYNKQQLTADDKYALGDVAVKLLWEIGGLVKNAYETSGETDTYRAAYTAVRRDAVKALSTACAVQYAEAPFNPAAALDVEIDSSWSETFESDYVYLRNRSGQDLTKCTIIIDLRGLKGEGAESDRHVHFVPQWPAGEWIYLRYPSRAAKGFATNESAGTLTDLTVDLFAEQFQSVAKHEYLGAEYDKDVERYMREIAKPEFSGSFSPGLISDDGFKVSFESSLGVFPVSHVTVKLIEGTMEREMRWKMNSGKWTSGFFGAETFSHEGFNRFDSPDQADVVIEFPCSSYKHSLHWNLN